MPKSVLLPFHIPIFATTQGSAAPCLALAEHPTAYNQILNQCTSLSCTRKFIRGFTTPQVGFQRLSIIGMPCLERYQISFRYTRPYIKEIIKQMIDEGYYVYYQGVDDFYLPGKSWYGTRHMSHDGIICGYDEADNTYSVAAYNINWVFDLIRIPQECFMQGIDSMLEQEIYGHLLAYKVKDQDVELNEKIIIKYLKEYLSHEVEKFPAEEDGRVYGIAVYDFLAMYIGKLKDGSIPYEKMDWRAIRPVWEHKKCMLERILAIESKRGWDNSLSDAYRSLVDQADKIRMMYAVYHKMGRVSILDGVGKGLLEIKGKEKDILNKLIDKMEADENETLEIHT